MKVLGVKEYKDFGDLSALQEYEVPTPEAQGHDLLVQVKAVATNPIDYKALANLGNGAAPVEGDAPRVVGWDGSGVVTQVGADCNLFKVGDEVMFAGDIFRSGAFGDYVLIDERIVGKKPKNTTWSEAASIPLVTLTAWETMIDQMKIPVDPETNAGKVILITGGAGGVATASIEVAKKVLGLTVVATGSRPESIAYNKQMGADHVINHHEPLGPQLKEIGFETVDFLMDTYGINTPETFAEYSEIVKAFGNLASIWPATSADLMKLFWKSINFSALLMFTRPTLEGDLKTRQHDILDKVADLVEDGVLTTKESETLPFSLENLKAALDGQAGGATIGKRTLTMA